MESNSVQNHVDDEDRLSKLPDDILLDILGKGSIHACIRASFSSRWRHLPSLLSHISLDISDFLRSDYDSLNPKAIDKAMSYLNKVARISLAASGRKVTLKAVSLRLLLATSYLYDIGKIVCDAIDNGEVKSLELALPTVKISLECCEMDMVRYAKSIVYFFEASTNLFRHITRLFLHNARFDELQMHRLLNSCEQLQYLVLNNCDTGDQSVLKTDTPNSKITYLKLFSCCFEKVEFLCLPKLPELHYDLWYSMNSPFSFGIVPCLEKVRLVSSMGNDQSGFKLSELLHGADEIHALTLDFLGDETSFNNLSNLFIHGIYAKFGLSWTLTLLEAAPFLKTFGIKVCDHVCTEKNRRLFAKRTNPWQKNKKLNRSRHLHLTRLEFGGFMAVKKHLQFVRAVMNYASSLETILLEDKDHCG
ncbi:putative F-box/LRR-repeat protein [Panicum miliaceum]|uniref:F-box/LRR-repeat protein n=1 Tax=Panicum miliaceum TaxID=4540 RepID=A0A3L6TPT1_PANMI|nr:putative F-box/LRR-repeat protein [Panicum miliaceum]